MDNNQTKSVDKHPRRSRWVRFLRGVGWTLAGLVALALLLAIPGMIIPPPRDPKAAALDNEDFGLGFKVGDKWDEFAMEKAIQSRRLPLERDEETEQFVENEKAASIDVINLAYWDSQDNSLQVSVSSNESKLPVLIDDVYMCATSPDYNYRDKKARAEVRQKLKEVEAMFPGDKEKQLAYQFRINALRVGRLFPQIKTGEGIGLGSSGDSVAKAYGKPTYKDSFGDYTEMLYYFGDGNAVSFSITMDCVSSMSSARMPSFSTPLGKLASWGVRIANWYGIESFELTVAIYEWTHSRESEEPK